MLVSEAKTNGTSQANMVEAILFIAWGKIPRGSVTYIWNSPAVGSLFSSVSFNQHYNCSLEICQGVSSSVLATEVSKPFLSFWDGYRFHHVTPVRQGGINTPSAHSHTGTFSLSHQRKTSILSYGSPHCTVCTSRTISCGAQEQGALEEVPGTCTATLAGCLTRKVKLKEVYYILKWWSPF